MTATKEKETEIVSRIIDILQIILHCKTISEAEAKVLITEINQHIGKTKDDSNKDKT